MQRLHRNLISRIIRLMILTGMLWLPEVVPFYAVSAETAAVPEEDSTREITFENPDVTVTTNIHYTGAYCAECHEKSPVEGGATYLRFEGDYDHLCRCHDFPPSICVHPSGVVPSPGIKERIPQEFPLEKKTITCLTCHDIYLQCRKQLFDRNSLRGVPYPNRTDFCFRCHDKEIYQAADPHKELNARGEIIEETCLICHEEKPDEKKDTYEDVTFVGDIEEACRRCHHISGNHSGDHDHIGVEPSKKGMKRITAMEKKYSARLPLDKDGKMTCITCHNPHEKGVVPEENPGAVGADSKNRLRLPGNICQECHQM